MKRQFSLWAIACIALFTACKKNNPGPSAEIQKANVYVTGYQPDPSSGRDKSGVWKNGLFTANSITANNSHYGYAMAVSGNDVYTTGFENAGSIWKCHVWKNGLYQYSLGDGYSYGSGIAVKGTDIYVSGYAYDQGPGTRYAMQWKNSNGPISVLASSSGITETSAIVTSGSDIYVAGRIGNDGKLWKNGEGITINDATECTITSLAVDGADVYAAGYTNSPLRVRYWKNGNAVNIPTSGSAYGNAITVVNGDVYIAGNDISGPKSIATYWKNGVAVNLGDGSVNSKANCIAVNGTDIYVAGEVQGVNTISDYATVWKNGQVTTIGAANSSAKAIIVK